MKTITKISAVIISLFWIASCTDQLELDPVSSVTESSYWETEEEANGALYGMYDQLRTQSDNRNILFLGSGRSELMGPSFGTGPIELWTNQLSPSGMDNSAYLDEIDWQGLYNVIHHANLLIQNVPDIEFTNEEDKNNILAQAYGMRAYVYFLLTRAWGEAVIKTEPTANLDSESILKERSSVEEVFTLIKSDLEEALRLFPDNTIPQGRYLWSRPSVNALKGDVYLWTAKKEGGGSDDIEIALSALNDIGNNADVELLADYEEVFDYDNKGNNEVLFAINYEQFESGENWGQVAYMANGYVPSNLTQESIDAIGAIGTVGGNFTISALAREQFHPDDQRGEGTTFKNVYTVNESGETEYYTTFLAKYDGTVINGVREFLDDIIIYRYADVLLMQAEAKNALGQSPADEINQIRRRAYGDRFTEHEFVSGSIESNDEIILQERLFELAFEGKRWFDLLRFDKAFDLVPSLQDRKGEDYLELFPIPQSIISLETRVSQNPGYE